MATIKKRKSKKHGTRYLAIVRRTGYPDTHKTFDTMQAAKDWAADLERDIRDRRTNPHALGNRKRLMDAVDTYLPKIEGSKNYKNTNRLLLWWKDKLGTALLSDLTAIGIDQALDGLSCQDPTKNRYLGALSGCLTFVSKSPYQWMPNGNPCRDVSRKSENKPRSRILTKPEFNTLLKHVSSSTKTARERQLPVYLKLAYATGRRRGELLKLRWVDYDAGEGVLYLMDTKTGDDQVAPLDAKTIKMLDKHRVDFDDGKNPYMFPGRLRNRATDFDELIRDAMRELFKPDRKGEMPVLHTIRHTVATELGDGGATEAQIMSVTGHKSSASVNRYVKKTVEAARTAQRKR